MPAAGTREGRVLAGGLLAAVILLALLVVGLPLYQSYARTAAEVERLAREIALTDAARRQAAAGREAGARLVREGAVRDLMLEPSSEGTALARMQERLTSAVDSAGGQMLSVQALPSEASGPLRRVGLRLQFAANAESLLTVLHGLEYGRPVAIIENVFIHASTAQAVGNERSLSVRLDIFSFLQPGA
jgi:general secretion pathway protein M